MTQTAADLQQIAPEAAVFHVRITRRNGVRALIADCRFDSRESAERYVAKYVPTFQQPEIVQTASRS